jgi:adenine-specific DNA-methyltransferase
MRHDATDAERRLWRSLRSNQMGFAFRRQHPIGPYIADFACLTAQLVIELDGGGHCEPAAMDYDKERDDYLRARGFRVVRISNREVLVNLDGVLREIERRLKEKE